MSYFTLKKLENDEYFYCYHIDNKGIATNKAFRYPAVQTKSGIFRYRKDWFFGLIKRNKWSKEDTTVNIIYRMKDRRDWEFMALLLTIVAIGELCHLIFDK